MYDFIKSIDLEKEIKTEDVFELFKTESFDMNLKFLSNVKSHKTLNEFVSYYSNQDFKNVLKIFDKLNSITLSSEEKKIKNIFSSKIDKYLSDISFIILQLSIIEKSTKLINNYIKSIKQSTDEFQNCTIQKGINNCINDLINSSPVLVQGNDSRRQSKEGNLSSYDASKGKRNSLFSNMTTDESEINFFEDKSNTPRFKEKEDSKKSNAADKKELSINKNSEKTIDSILSLKNMKFLYDIGDKNLRTVKKKNKTIKIGFEKEEAEYFLKQKSNSNKISENNNLNDRIEYNQKLSDKSQILAELLNSVNCLFKNGKIDSEQKLFLKHLLIDDSGNIIDRFLKFNENNIPFNTNLKNVFKNFLISELKKA